MSAINGSRSLPCHHNKLEIKRWKQETATDHYKQRTGNCTRAFVVTLLSIPLTIFFIWYLQWLLDFEAPGSIPIEPPSLDSAAGPARDLKFVLHPEDHLSREPGIRHFSWNITKAIIAPNGVQKETFLINGTANYYLCAMIWESLWLWQIDFPVPQSKLGPATSSWSRSST